MARFTGTLMIIGSTSFLDNVLLVRNNDPATATSFLQNRGLGSGDPVIITGTHVMINTTPAIEVEDAQRAAAAALAASRRAVRKMARKKTAAKRTKGKGKKEPRS